MHTRGFTLIEILVVVAIIGILTSVVMGSLNTARDRAEDASVRANMSAMRSQAELYHEVNGSSFEGVCDNTAGVGGVKTIYMGVSEAVFATGGSSVGTGPTTVYAGTCNDDVSSWAAEASLKTGGFYCIDNTGKAATSTTALLGAGEMICE